MLICETNPQQQTRVTHQALYQGLLRHPERSEQRDQAIDFLHQQLQQARVLASDLPKDIEALQQWSDAHVAKVGKGYQSYLQRRKAGGPREYFDNRSHALFYLQTIAPTKLVDGAWLYGLINHWREERFFPLIKTYVEELGEGLAQQNHVLLYQKLLERNGCLTHTNEADPLYLQGAIQLALGHYSAEFLPEILGYNLGYEQPPLHMLITAYELKELGIDPYYFTIHITTDNASSGHARQAVDAVHRLAPAVGSKQAFYERVKAGYQLNFLGPDSAELLASFGLYQQTVNMLENKRFYGANMHSDFCRLEGKTVNEWLQTPGHMDAFLNTLIKTGWVKRGTDPQQSRFWQLIGAENAKMAGVFSAYEAQLIYDWIADGWGGATVVPLHSAKVTAANARRQAARVTNGAGSSDSSASTTGSTTGSTSASKTASPAAAQLSGARAKALSRPAATHSSGSNALSRHSKQEGDPDYELRQLQRELNALPLDEKMNRLVALMAPHSHSTEAGLFATQAFWNQLCR